MLIIEIGINISTQY